MKRIALNVLLSFSLMFGLTSVPNTSEAVVVSVFPSKDDVPPYFVQGEI
jgi:hypothetical protein